MTLPARDRAPRFVTALLAAFLLVPAAPALAASGMPNSAGQPATGTSGSMLSLFSAGKGATAVSTYLVLARDVADDTPNRERIRRAGGDVLNVNPAVGLYTIRASGRTAAALADSGAFSGVARNRVIAKAPPSTLGQTRPASQSSGTKGTVKSDRSRQLSAGEHSAVQPVGTDAPVTAARRRKTDPLTGRQWDMAMMHTAQAHKIATGAGVRVGIMDTGVDASHPDIKPRFNLALSRNFTTDLPEADGPCAQEPDKSCKDPVTVDENEHGTHVAGIIAAPRNGRGTVGVAPDAQIVNLRTGQDSGLFFLAPTVNALTYAADHGIDVVNMSYFIDPWLFNCPNNSADSAAARKEQRTIIEATQRALRYAGSRGVTMVAAAGNEHADLDAPTEDRSSPDYPKNAAHPRRIDNSCLVLPTEGPGVVSVGSVGPSGLKADYSNWGLHTIDVSAPGGYASDFFGTRRYGSVENMILAPMPKAIVISKGAINVKTGASTAPSIISDCPAGKASCAYYQYLEGTSMASPHAAGVAALIVSKYGKSGRGAQSGMTTTRLMRSARDAACPKPVYDYPDMPAEYTSRCTGNPARNSWYGEGVVDALAAVAAR